MSSDSAPVRGVVPGTIRLGMVVLDTPDPPGLAAFYSELLGWELQTDGDEDWVTIRQQGAPVLAFQRAPGLPPVTWPEPSVPQQAHLDFHVPSYDDAEARALALGAVLLDASDDHPDFRVYADPSGHPFCLCLESQA